jgi:hypothetical protein
MTENNGLAGVGTVNVADNDEAAKLALTLGGSLETNGTITGTEKASTAGTTAGKSARKRSNAKAGKVAKGASTEKTEKRHYTERGSTYKARRVVLLNGEPVGKGRPQKEGKGGRTVVYIPENMPYDKAIHGLGVKFNANSHKALFRRLAKDKLSYTFDPKSVKGGKKAVKTGKGKSASKGKTGTKRTRTVVAVPVSVPEVATVTESVAASTPETAPVSA